MEPTKFFDAYSIRARLFPAVIAAAPALAAIALLVSWSTLGLSNAIASIGMLALMFAIADLSRARGRKLECRLYADHGGLPSITMFRRSDQTIDSGLKNRYRKFLAEQLGVQAPDAEVELLDKSAADGFYDQCGAWLRQNTRDSKRFSILFAENVTYGFRRKGSTPTPRTVVKGWRTSNPAWRSFAASSGCGTARCIRTHPLLPHRVSGTSCDRSVRA